MDYQRWHDHKTVISSASKEDSYHYTWETLVRFLAFRRITAKKSLNPIVFANIRPARKGPVIENGYQRSATQNWTDSLAIKETKVSTVEANTDAFIDDSPNDRYLHGQSTFRVRNRRAVDTL